MEELNTEIDRLGYFGVADLQGILSNHLKPLMENVLTESYYLLHLLEHLRPKALQAVGDVETEEQLSEMDTVTMQLADLKQLLIRTKEEKLNMCTELQKKLCASENMVRSLQLELRSSQCSIQSLRDNLHRSEDTVQILKAELKRKEARIHLLKERVLLAQDSTKFIQEDTDVSKDLSQTLQQRPSATEEQNHALKKAPIACETQLQEVKSERQQEAESKPPAEFYKSLIKSLKRTITIMKAENKAKVEELQHTLDKAKEEARETELKLHTDFIGLKRKLVDEHTVLARELKKSMEHRT